MAINADQGTAGILRSAAGFTDDVAVLIITDDCLFAILEEGYRGRRGRLKQIVQGTHSSHSNRKKKKLWESCGVRMVEKMAKDESNSIDRSTRKKKEQTNEEERRLYDVYVVYTRYDQPRPTP